MSGKPETGAACSQASKREQTDLLIAAVGKLLALQKEILGATPSIERRRLWAHVAASHARLAEAELIAARAPTPEPKAAGCVQTNREETDT